MERTTDTTEIDANERLRDTIRDLENNNYDTPVEKELDEIMLKVLRFIADKKGLTFKEALMLKNITAILDALLPESFNLLVDRFNDHREKFHRENNGKPSGDEK